MELLTVSLLNGVVYGLLLFMLSSGLTLIFSMMGVLNFAHGAFSFFRNAAIPPCPSGDTLRAAIASIVYGIASASSCAAT